MGTIWCDCANAAVPEGGCDFCTEDWQDDEDFFEDPPLYPVGKLAGMSTVDLHREFDKQCDRQGRLGDAERIDDRAVEDTEARCRLVEAELKRRGER